MQLTVTPAADLDADDSHCREQIDSLQAEVVSFYTRLSVTINDTDFACHNFDICRLIFIVFPSALPRET